MSARPLKCIVLALAAAVTIGGQARADLLIEVPFIEEPPPTDAQWEMLNSSLKRAWQHMTDTTEKYGDDLGHAQVEARYARISLGGTPMLAGWLRCFPASKALESAHKGAANAEQAQSLDALKQHIAMAKEDYLQALKSIDAGYCGVPDPERRKRDKRKPQRLKRNSI